MTANATHPGRITIPGTDIGVRGTLVAEPQTENELLTLSDRLALGPVKVDTDHDGVLQGTGLVVPIVTGVLWLLRFEPHKNDVPAFTLGVYNLNTSGVDLKDLVETVPTAIDATAMNHILDLETELATFTTANDAVVSPLFNSGTATRAAADKAYGRGISVRAHPYSADNTGATDASAAIRSAITAATAAGTYAWLPEGTYLISEEGTTFGCLNLPNNARLMGPGTLKMAVPRLISTGPDVYAGVRPIFADGKTNVSVFDLTVDMNNQNATGMHALFFNDTVGVNVTRAKVKNALRGGIMLSGQTKSVTIRDCDIVTDFNGITIYGDNAGNPCEVDDVLIEGNRITTTIQPVDSEPVGPGYASNVRIRANTLKTTTDNYAITMGGPSTTARNRNWLVEGNILTGAVFVGFSSNSRIVNNQIDATASTTKNAIHGFFGNDSITVSGNNISAASGMDGVALAISTTRPVDWTITNNDIFVTGSAARGVRLDGCGPVTVANNRIHGVNSNTGIRPNATVDMESVIITGNSVDGFATGIDSRVTSTLVIKRLTIGGNQVDNTQGTPTATTGIALTGTAAQFQQTTMYGNLVAPVYTTDYSLGSVLLREGSASPATWSGNGTPEGVVTAKVGADYKRRDGGTGTSKYVKESGTGNTGWSPVAAASAPIVPVYLSADSAAVNNSTTAVDTGLQWTVAASSVYAVTAFVVYSASTAADVGLSWTMPAAASLTGWTVDAAVVTASTVNNTINRSSLGSAAVGQAGGIGVGTKMVATPMGTLTTGVNAGTLKLQFAQVTADATNAVVHAGSWLKLEKIA